MKNLYVFVLGAPDMEMSAIEDLLLKYRLPYLYAFYHGVRVNASNAYRASFIGKPNGSGNDYHFMQGVRVNYVFVECAFIQKGKKFTGWRIDHHSEGDFGYNKGPDKYWEGSSIGQVVDFIQKRCNMEVEITPKMRYIAASDHCPNAAYRGECRGIDPEMLKLMRLEEHGRYNRLDVFECAVSMNNTVRAIDRFPVRVVDGVGVYQVDVKLAMLRDAAMYSGKVVEAIEKTEDKEIHYLLGSTTKPLVIEWLKEMRKHPKFDSEYGSPARGYATVSLKRQ